MKLNKKIAKKVLALLTAGLLTFSFAGCSNIASDGEAVETAYGRVAFSVSDNAELTDIVLKYGSKKAGSWSTASELKSDTVLIPVGTYTFTLSATYDGSTVKGTCEGTITADSTTALSFNLSRVSSSEWSDDDDDDLTDSSNEDGEVTEIPASSEGLTAFVSLVVSDISASTISSETITNNVKIIPSESQAIVIDSSSTTIGSTKYSKRLKLAKAGSKTSDNVTIYVGANQTGTLTIDCKASSNDTTRPLMANDTEIGKAPYPGTVSASVTADENGYIAIYSGTSESTGNAGINLYGIYWSSGSSSGGVEKIVDSEPQMPTLDNSTVAPSYSYGRKVGMRSRLSEIDTDSITDVIFVSPSGTASGEGTKASPMDLQTAINKVTAGGAVVLKSGTYKFSSTIKIAYGNDGTAGAMKYILPESGKAAVLDFSTQAVDDSARGVQLDGSYWHIYGITCYNAGDNGMYVTGKHNIVERCIFQANQDTGLQIARRSKDLSDMADWPSDNLILNCTSFDNKDDKTGDNADGFASKLTCGEGNVFDGCISYANCDDGWDLYAKPATGSIGVVTIRNCVAYQNGKTTSGQNYANGDMNGFKLGGSNNQCPTPHVVYNCASFLNGKDGFTDNGNGGALQVSNCTSYGNVNSNFNFYRTFAGGVFKKLVASIGSTTPAQLDKFGGKESEVTVAAKISDSVYCADKKKGTFYYVTDETEIYNGSKVGDVVSDPYSSEFINTSAPEVNMTVDATCRNTDGTINLNGFLETKSSSTYSAMGVHFGDEAETVLEVYMN